MAPASARPARKSAAARGLRYADLVLASDKRESLVRAERHNRGKVAEHRRVPLDGSGATDETRSV